METTQTINKHDRVERAIACALYYTEQSRAAYDTLLIESCWRYAYDFGDERILVSETFWGWFKNQFYLKTLYFSDSLAGMATDGMDVEDFRELFNSVMIFDIYDVFPNSTIHNIITNDVYMALNAQGGVLW